MAGLALLPLADGRWGTARLTADAGPAHVEFCYESKEQHPTSQDEACAGCLRSSCRFLLRQVADDTTHCSTTFDAGQSHATQAWRAEPQHTHLYASNNGQLVLELVMLAAVH